MASVFNCWFNSWLPLLPLAGAWFLNLMWLANLIGANENGEGIGNMGLVSLTTLDRKKKNVSLNFMAMAGRMFYSLFNIKSVNFYHFGWCCLGRKAGYLRELHIYGFFLSSRIIVPDTGNFQSVIWLCEWGSWFAITHEHT